MTGEEAESYRQQKIDYILSEIVRRYPSMKANDIATILLRPDNPEAETFAGLSYDDLILRLSHIAFES